MSSMDCRGSICGQKERKYLFPLSKKKIWWFLPGHLQTLTCAFWIASCSSSSKLRTLGKAWTGLAVICTGSSKSWPITSHGWQQNTWLESRFKSVDRWWWEYAHVRGETSVLVTCKESLCELCVDLHVYLCKQHLCLCICFKFSSRASWILLQERMKGSSTRLKKLKGKKLFLS